MKVLISAYACRPNWGSEPEVGWRWAIEVARLGHEVWVLTHAPSRQAIERELTQTPRTNLHFLYYNPPAWLTWWKKGLRGIHLHYLLWQWGAYRLAKRAHAEIGFDMAHHITYVAIRQPSFMGNLGIPFIFGPVGGGERAPWRLRRGYGWRGLAKDAARDVSNALIRIDPLMRRTFRLAHTIYVTTPESRRTVPRRWRFKTKVQQAAGTNTLPKPVETIGPTPTSALRVLYVGRFIYLKGMHLGLAAFHQFRKKCTGASLTMVGGGPDEKRWRKLAGASDGGNAMRWMSWADREELTGIYDSHDVLLLPSLHDSGSLVALEAISHGLPVLCLDLGGPATLVNDTCGRVVATKGRTKAEVVHGLTEALEELQDDPQLRARLSTGARRRAATVTWRDQVLGVYSGITGEGVKDAAQ